LNLKKKELRVPFGGSIIGYFLDKNSSELEKEELARKREEEEE